MAKKINWPVIKKRYLQGDKPATIGKDYGIPSKAIRDKAYRENWATEKATVCDKIATKIVESVERDLTTLAERLMVEYERLAFSDISKLAEWGSKSVKFKDSETLTPDETACVSAVSQGATGEIKLKLHNKLGAMDSLAEIVGLKKPASKEPEPTTIDVIASKELSELSDSELDRLIKES